MLIHDLSTFTLIMLIHDLSTFTLDLIIKGASSQRVRLLPCDSLGFGVIFIVNHLFDD